MNKIEDSDDSVNEKHLSTLQVFYNIFDLAAINAWILYKDTSGVNICRKNFIFQLVEELRSDLCDEPSNCFN